MLVRQREILVGSVDLVHWWVLIPIAVALAVSLYGVFRWSSGDPAIDEEIARQRFRAEQDWRGVRRSGDAPATPSAPEQLQNVR